jgi:hypothetical protein
MIFRLIGMTARLTPQDDPLVERFLDLHNKRGSRIEPPVFPDIRRSREK